METIHLDNSNSSPFTVSIFQKQNPEQFRQSLREKCLGHAMAAMMPPEKTYISKEHRQNIMDVAEDIIKRKEK